MSLEVRGLTVSYGDGPIVVDRVDLDIPDGSTVGLVGESGSGKSTLARAIVGLANVTAGSVEIDGTEVTNARRGDALSVLRRTTQMVFQDPNASLNPRMTVGATLAEAARVGVANTAPVGGGASSKDVQGLVDRGLDLVGLPTAFVDRYPFELSGGQRQRVAIARALAARPRFVLLDEVTASLDVSMQAVVLNLLRDLQSELGLGYLVISHDLTIVRFLCDRVAVMELGSIKEFAASEELFGHPSHPYTRALIDAVPRLGGTARNRIALAGDPPDPRDRQPGCSFAGRCPQGPVHRDGRSVCGESVPILQPVGSADRHEVACHFPLE